MFMGKSKKKQQQGAPLPIGFDQEGSLFYVREHVRQAYLDEPGQEVGVLTAEKVKDAATAIATREASEQHGPWKQSIAMGVRHDEDRDRRQGWQSVFEQTQRDLLEEPTEELALLIEHLRRLRLAEQRQERLDREQVREAARRDREMCPVCKVDDVARCGGVKRRAVNPGADDTATWDADRGAQEHMWFTSCGLCFLVKQSQLTGRATTELLGDGRSRAEVVAAAPIVRASAMGIGRGQKSDPSWGSNPGELVL